MQNKLKEQISAASQISGLPESVLEKDYHVTRVIKKLSHQKNEYFHLIFSGGTCLAKAHKIINRMSEDIDFKLCPTHKCQQLSKSKINKELKKFRKQIISILEPEGFNFYNPIIRNDGRYVQLNMDYPSQFKKSKSLRTELQLELTISQIRSPTISLTVAPLVQDILKNKVDLATCTLLCVSINETAAEKWVALMRKVSAMERGYVKKDSTLIRHLYDIATIRRANKMEIIFYELSKHIIQQDAIQFKTQHPEFFENPFQEITRSFSILEQNSNWLTSYAEFIEVMVFDKSDINYFDSIQILKKMNEKIMRI